MSASTTARPAARRLHARVTRVEVETDRGVFMISVAAELAEMHPQTLRMYEERGLIEPKRSPKGTRLYSHDDVERLRRIQEMTAELGMNLAGVERVFELEEQLERDARADRGARSARRCRRRCAMAEELERVRRSLRAELVPNARAKLERVRAVDARSPFTDLPSKREEQQTASEATMQPDRFTIKSQEALQAGRAAGGGAPQPAGRPAPSTLLARAARAGLGIVVPGCSPSSAPTPTPFADQRRYATLDALPTLARAPRRGTRPPRS